MRTDSIFQDDGSIDWSVTETPSYQRKVARELARAYAKYTPAEKADWDRYVAMLDYARARAVYPAKGREEALLLVWWRDGAPADMPVDDAFDYYVGGGR